MKKSFPEQRIRRTPSRAGIVTGLAAILFLSLHGMVFAAGEDAGRAGENPAGGVFAERLDFHRANKADLRISPIAAADRRRAIPNDARPPLVREPSARLAPLPASMDGTIRRVAVRNGEKVCALTFDLCELATVTTGFDADIITWLQDNSIPATLFMGGKWMRTHARRVREVMRDPLFEIGTHGWAHGNFGIMSEARMREELSWASAQYEELRRQAVQDSSRLGGGEIDIPETPSLFRFPYGRCSDKALRLVGEAGLRAVQWDVVGEAGSPSLDVGRSVANRVRPGSILLFHANLVPTGTFQLLRYVVRELAQKGYRFVTVGELLALGEPEISREGYFVRPGDNLGLDGKFGYDGTGAQRPR